MNKVERIGNFIKENSIRRLITSVMRSGAEELNEIENALYKLKFRENAILNNCKSFVGR